MSKRGYISRYALILKKLKSKPHSSFNDLQSYIENQINYLQLQDDALNIGFSKRTLQRDIREIRNVFGIDIEYSKSQKGYFISESEAENANFQRMLEAFDIFNLLNQTQDLTPFIYLENRKSSGTEHFYGILHAIKNKKITRLSHYKYEDKLLKERTVHPLALKESRGRWYVMAVDTKDNKLKAFGLDRIQSIDIFKTSFKEKYNYNISELFKHSFGIINDENKLPQKVVLSFNEEQGKYVNNYPLHHSQKLVKENTDEMIFELFIQTTYDFEMELLSYGEEVKIISPSALCNRMKQHYQNALKQY